MTAPAVADPPSPQPTSSRRRLWLLLALACVGLGALAAGWRYRVTRPDYCDRRGRQAITAKDWDDALRMVDRLSAAGEGDRAEVLRGEMLIAQGDFAAALKRLQRVSEKGPRVRAALLSGRCLLELRHLRQAYQAFSWGLERDPDDIDGHRGLAAVSYDLGQMNLALFHLSEWARLDPKTGLPHRLTGLIYKHLNDYDRALPAYKKALERELPKDFTRQVELERAEIFFANKKWDDALAALDGRGPPAEEDNTLALALRAECLGNLNRMPEAREVLSRARRAYPTDPRLLLVDGEFTLAQGDPARAVPLFERVVAAMSGDYRARYGLGRAYAAALRPDDAEREQKKAQGLLDKMLKLNDLSLKASDRPWDAELRVEIGQLWEELSDSRMAAMWFRAAQACREDKE